MLAGPRVKRTLKLVRVRTRSRYSQLRAPGFLEEGLDMAGDDARDRLIDGAFRLSYGVFALAHGVAELVQRAPRGIEFILAVGHAHASGPRRSAHGGRNPGCRQRPPRAPRLAS